MARIDAFFKLMAEQKASDLHLATGNPPMLRINGDLVRVDYPPLQNDELKAMVYEIAPEGKIKIFEETLDVDFGYEVPGIARYRANFFQQKVRHFRRFPADSFHRPNRRGTWLAAGPEKISDVEKRPRSGDRPHRVR